MSKKKKQVDVNTLSDESDENEDNIDEPMPPRDCLRYGKPFLPTITNSRICESCRKANSRYSHLAFGIGWKG
ncbi:MAG: hypothetical protein A2Y82_05170 [Candidatus Buchananbacteria bacterium RBG_13_36_9]|uniref:Uncharacterized protein n=1 Tax=Candidatus Buchananbacteria bacterium RBG_13_36_9 TaxID=1797530 RepID=A0A1G1XPG7_9BACT|nr:MAG: hypothetical protein A2Y82_05170 [Candidatus Buchananbacteria bacterium RBG_13_36_9]